MIMTLKMLIFNVQLFRCGLFYSVSGIDSIHKHQYFFLLSRTFLTNTEYIARLIFPLVQYQVVLSILIYVIYACSWEGRSQPCQWTVVVRLSGPNTLRYSRQTSRLSQTLISRMARGCLWPSKTWAAVRSTLRALHTTRMAGRTSLPLRLASGVLVATRLRDRCDMWRIPGLWQSAVTASTSSIRRWRCVTRVSARPRSLSGAMTRLSTLSGRALPTWNCSKTLKRSSLSNQTSVLKVSPSLSYHMYSVELDSQTIAAKTHHFHWIVLYKSHRTSYRSCLLICVIAIVTKKG